MVRDQRGHASPIEAAELARRAAPGQVLGFVGPRGSGRSTVLSEAASGIDAVRLAGRPGEQHDDLLAVAHLLGEEPPADAAGRLAAFRGALGDDPVLLVDDIDLLDPASSALICAAAGRAGEWNATVIATGASFPAEWPGARLELTPIAPDQSGAAGRFDMSTEELERAVVATGGRPGLLAAHAAGALDATVADWHTHAGPNAQLVASALAWGARANDDSITATTGLARAEVDDAIAELTSGSLVGPDGTPPPGVAAALRAATDTTVRHRICDVLADLPVADRAIELAEWLDAVEDRTGRAAGIYAAAAAELRATDPEKARSFVEAAAGAGALEDDQRLVLAEIEFRGGDAAAALQTLHGLADDSRTAGVLALSASVLALGGRAADAAEVVGELRRTDPDMVEAQLAPLHDAGQGGGSATGGSPIGTRGVAAKFAAAAATWMNEGASSLPELADAATAAGGLPGVELWPWHPLEVLASAAAAEGELQLAGQAIQGLGSGLERRAGARTAMLNLRSSRLGEVGFDWAPPAPTTRDTVTVLAIAGGLALRQQQTDQLDQIAEAGLATMQPDLWSWDVWHELTLLSARTQGIAAALDVLGQMDDLAVSHSPGSAVRRALAWTRVMVGVVVDDAPTVAAGAAALQEGPESLERRASAAFDAIFNGNVADADVEDTAAALKDAGWTFEASQLSAAAALRTSDETAARDLLALSRSLRGERRQAARGGGDVDALSDREVEVARLVVSGRTHKEIGAELFISAKTVEHHVARVRRKLGATSRAEMMAGIRDYLDRHDSLD